MAEQLKETSKVVEAAKRIMETEKVNFHKAINLALLRSDKKIK